MFDPEAAAVRMREAAGLRADELPGAVGFAERFLGKGRVLIVAPEEVWGDGEATHDGLVLVRTGLDPAEREFVVFHECAEIWIARVGERFDCLRTKERACDAVAAALQAPPAFFVDAVLEFGAHAFAELAHDFRATQTSMALRVGEVVRCPVRVERPGLVRERGRAHDWAGGGARRVELTDAPSRVVYLAA